MAEHWFDLSDMKVRFFQELPVMGNMLRVEHDSVLESVPHNQTNWFDSNISHKIFGALVQWIAHVESDPDKDTIQQPIHSIHKDEIGVRFPGAPPKKQLTTTAKGCIINT